MRDHWGAVCNDSQSEGRGIAMNQRNLQPLVSVIVPVYNVEKYLVRCLDSIVGQTYRNLDIILVNDGSTDGSGEVCRRYAGKDSRIRLFEQENGGLSAARNVGLENMDGEYVVFVDSDDYISLVLVEILLSKLLEFGVEVAACDRIIVGENEDDASMEIYAAGNSSVCERISREKALNPGDERIQKILIPAYNKVYKRSVFEGIRFDEGKTCEDIFIFHKIYVQVNEVCVVKLKMYAYRQRENSISKGNGIPRVSKDCIEARFEQMVFFQRYGMGKYAKVAAKIALLDYTLLQDYPSNKKLRDDMREFENRIDRILGFRPFSLKYELFKAAPRAYQFLRRIYKKLQFTIKSMVRM